MIQKSVPGHTLVFGIPPYSYETALANLSSSSAISIAIALNNELGADLPYHENQHRILEMTKKSYAIAQTESLNYNLNRLAVSGFGRDAYELFHRRYLLSLLIKELRRNQQGPAYIQRPGEEFPFLIAYLLTIDEEHAKDRIPLDIELNQKDDPFFEYRIIWGPYIRQYQFNESVSPLFELFKLISLCHYAFKNWRSHLKQFLSSYNLHTIGQLASSYNQVFNALLLENPKGPLKKLVHIKPINNLPALHLQSLSINSQFGNVNATLLDLKKRPLLQTDDGRYRVIDANFFFKHTYKGPFFDLVKTTGLEKEIGGFNKYSEKVSKHVIEEVCFKTIIETLKSSDGVLVHEAKTDTASDGYYRQDKIILLMECKAYILNDSYAEQPDFEKLKIYIEENFVQKRDGTPKGAGQLINQLALLRDGQLNSDSLPALKSNEQYIIYPIIFHNDFQFSLPGINEYINRQFLNKVNKDLFPQFDIQNLTLINLDCLFDIALRRQSFISLIGFIDAYWNSINLSKTLLSSNFRSELFLNSKISFDELYQTRFIKDLPDIANNPERLTNLLQTADIHQAMLDEVV